VDNTTEMSMTMEVLSHFNKKSALKDGDEKLSELLKQINSSNEVDETQEQDE